MREHGIRYELDDENGYTKTTGARHHKSRRNKRCPPGVMKISTRKKRSGKTEKKKTSK